MAPFPILLTNDDGINSIGLQELAASLNARGHPVVVLAPLAEQSAVGMKLTLRDDMAFQEHPEIAEMIRKDGATPLRVFSLDGSPCDCVIVAIDGGLRARAPGFEPWLCISGINRGPNLSVDVLHSGTVSAAREAALYGLPSLSVSLATYSHQDYSQSIEATLRVIDGISEVVVGKPENLLRPDGTHRRPGDGADTHSIRKWFLQGNMFLNLNIPETWDESFQTVPLGARWYRNATDMIDKESVGVTFEVGAARIVDEDIEMTDCNAVRSGSASITPLASWPQNHPLGVPQSVMEESTNMGEGGLPSWF
jgi:5'/3'-nucleotidase SurE